MLRRNYRWLAWFIGLWLLLGTTLAHAEPFTWKSFSAMKKDGWYLDNHHVCPNGKEMARLEWDVEGDPSSGWVMLAFLDGVWLAVWYISDVPFSWSHGTWQGDSLEVLGNDLPMAEMAHSGPCSWHNSLATRV